MKDSLHILASFLETADQIIYESEQENIKNAWKSVIYNKDFAMIPSVVIPMDSLEEMLHIAYDRQGESISIRNYFAGISSNMAKRKLVDKLKISTMFSTIKTSISDIRPAYLAQYADGVKAQCDTIVKTGNVKSVLEKLKENDYLLTLKRQLVVSPDRDFYYKRSGEMMYDIKRTLTIDATTIDKLIIPFLYQFEQNATVGKPVKEPCISIKGETFGEMVNSVIVADRYATRLIANCIKTLFRVADDVKLDTSLLGRYCYKIQAIYNELVKFLVASLMQYMQSYLNNMKSCAYVYQQMKQAIPESEVVKLLTESADQYDNPGEIPTLANMNTLLSAIEYMKNKIGLEVEDDIDIEGDVLSYKQIEDRYNRILSTIASIVVKLQESPDQSLEDIIQYTKADQAIGGEGNAIPVRFLEFYQMCEWKKEYIYADLKKMRHWIPKIVSRIDNAVDNLGQYIEEIKNDTTHYPNHVLNQTVIKYMGDLSERLLTERKNFLEAVEKKLMQSEWATTTTSTPKAEAAFDTSDEFPTLYKTNLELLEAMYESVKEDINFKYTEIYAKKSSGLFLEDDNNNGNNNQQNNNQNNQKNHGENQNNQGTNNGQNNNANGKNQQSTKPVVTDNSGNNNQQNNNQNNNNKNGSTGTPGKLKDKISGFIQTIIDNITEFMEKKGGKKNLNLIKEQKSYLQSRSFANVSSTLLPYIDVDYKNTLDKILHNAQNIPDNVLQAGNFEQIQRSIFAGTAFANIKGDGSMGEKLVQAFKVGNAPLEVKEFSNNELKNVVNKGIKFCEDYYNNFAKDLGSFKDKIGNTNFYPGKKNNGDNDKTEESIAFIGTCINTAVASAKKAAQERANDIMVIVNSLKDSNASGNNSNQQDSNNQNQDNGNNNQNADQNQNNNQ